MDRKIEPELVKFLDAKLATNPMFALCLENKDIRQLLIIAAHAMLGIREEGGNNKGKLVELIQETVGGHDREAWCMSTQQSLIAYAEIKLGRKSRFPVTEHCMTAWKTATADLHIKYPLPGAIIIWQHGKTTNGHTGILLDYNPDKKSMLCIEGNTESGLTEDGSIQREGGGVYLTKRSTVANGEMHVVGFLKPF